MILKPFHAIFNGFCELSLSIKTNNFTNHEKETIFNNYSPKAKLILLNNPRDEVEGIIQQY